jgi:hypothetical protein
MSRASAAAAAASAALVWRVKQLAGVGTDILTIAAPALSHRHFVIVPGALLLQCRLPVDD